MIKILAIDDNRNNLVALTALLSNAFPDVCIITAESGSDGIVKAHAERPDVILLDLVMPIMDGIETCKRLKDDRFLKRIPVIMITAYQIDSKIRTNALESGVEAFLSKPIDAAELTAQVSSMIRLKKSENLVLLENERLEERVIIRTQELIKELEDRKQLEEALRKSEERYRALFDRSLDCVYILDFKGRFIDANDAALNLFGLKREKIYGVCFESLLSDDQLPLASKTMHEIQETGLQKELREFKLKLRNNNEVYIETQGSAILSQGKYTAIQLVARNITERKQAEQALLQSEENFHRSISESPLGIRIVSVDGKTIYANKVFLDIFELIRLEEFTSLLAINRYTPESYAQHQERKEKRKKGHDVLNYDISIVRENAEIRHVKVSRKEILWNGIKHYQITNIDITEQKKLTIDLIAAKKKAEESDHLKSAFLANMSHEIRTPMNGILGFADLLKEPELTGEKQQEYIGIIEKSGLRMLNIINDLIDISKVESGQMKISISETNVNEQIEYIYTFFKPEVERKGLQIFFQNGLRAEEAIIRNDREKLYAILTNLVKNAIKYSDTGTIEFGYTLKDKYLVFFIKDTGIGIPDDKKEVIFDRFIQADIFDKRAFQGAGLGLAISKAYVEMLGGKIWVESEEGKGSTFYFTIPYNTVPQEIMAIKNVVSRDKDDSQIKKLKILIAEDDATSEKLLIRIVEKYCKEDLHVRTGVEAVDACRNNPDIDLVLMDIQMQVMDGYEATRQIRQFNKDVIIIAQTAFGLIGDKEKSLAAGCNDYISKPIDKALLRELIKKHFN